MTEFNSKIKKNSRILKIFMFSICALFACAISSHAQSLVKGTVTDGIGEPLPGVSVVVKGTTNGTITDVNGKYSIQATAKDILSFSYVGMSDQEIKVAGQTTINVVMKDDVAALDEVIVVGYGTAKKQSLTGAVSAVKGDELLKAPATNVSSLLGGRLPGISSVQVSGEPGDDQATLRVRGSIYNVTYIVDGMPRSINDIDPNDIESVSVLKDGASAAVYGLKGAGGVIIITTKKGQEGKSKIIQAALHDSGGAGPHPVGQLGPGEDHIQKDEQIVVLSDIVLELCALGGQLRKDALNLLLLPGLELLEFVVGLHHPHGLNEEGGARGGHVVDQAGDSILMFRLHRHHVPVGADGDDGLLEVLGLVGGDDLLQNVPHLGLGGPHVPADGGQLGAGRVGNLILPQDGVGDGVLQKPVGREGAEQMGDGGLLLSPAILPYAAGAAQHRRNVQQLTGAETAPHVRTLVVIPQDV